jgi:hypothetical protein
MTSTKRTTAEAVTSAESVSTSPCRLIQIAMSPGMM